MYYGLHLEKFYLMCDNCTYEEIDIVGDGIIFEKSFIQLEVTPPLFSQGYFYQLFICRYLISMRNSHSWTTTLIIMCSWELVYQMSQTLV